MSSILSILGRDSELFITDIMGNSSELNKIVSESTFLVLGGAGSIGQSVVKEIFKRGPKKLHVVDISENNVVELVRDIRSTFGYISGEFKTFALDIGSIEYDALIESDGQYDYVLNLSALKHVRSEKDPFTLMRMIDVNIFNTDKTILQSIEAGVKKYFCVSTDKAANPVNMMGASKRIMEMFLMRRSKQINISTARFANVAFSDGSLLHGFNQRILKRQPIVAPNDIRRYFVTPKESGELCLMSCIFGENRDIFFPKLNKDLDLITFSEIAERYLRTQGFTPVLCSTEDEARELAKILPSENKWPCLFVSSDTTGEKDFEEFYTDSEILDMNRFENIGIIKNSSDYNSELIYLFEEKIQSLKSEKCWTKEQLVELFFEIIPGFGHKETGKYLDAKM
ncbi:UDP-N-acetylglucosamine 4,6-dehydratase [Yersinia enterocolitica]|uniref:UDP-N-acetylglucosamine 4,6-dehydratase n=1 Tax=Yersinia enterocolitica TaxID=630 RepID=UPI00155A5B94|nr:UDP-N-acetylglucosamine 4,6-dehydratase [Yersinia enterocolitica]MBX9482611.1 UDP-N-acetylglucosamine 4,6-dehydratase [Yersinia enterocolitica]NQS94647.1 UDP-N-acetylglucosamine 4,6-dehydratase [Yersinia enterocolitica]NQT44857.1 UDP-N-acetylglucosamine 4,6-dehydratase [Yersinia enterocolitica]NQT99346.1 UDP-N-acetylglucosamine 4,6-dehydratase [Yersinia enterocolitica]HDL6874750.1 UDP-N-acetylglucosamine 4,6-dehydratase [Yersinia enterocolitica]